MGFRLIVLLTLALSYTISPTYADSKPAGVIGGNAFDQNNPLVQDGFTFSVQYKFPQTPLFPGFKRFEPVISISVDRLSLEAAALARVHTLFEAMSAYNSGISQEYYPDGEEEIRAILKPALNDIIIKLERSAKTYAICKIYANRMMTLGEIGTIDGRLILSVTLGSKHNCLEPLSGKSIQPTPKLNDVVELRINSSKIKSRRKFRYFV